MEKRTTDKMAIPFKEWIGVSSFGANTGYDIINRPDFKAAFRVGRKIFINVKLYQEWLDRQCLGGELCDDQ